MVGREYNSRDIDAAWQRNERIIREPQQDQAGATKADQPVHGAFFRGEHGSEQNDRRCAHRPY